MRACLVRTAVFALLAPLALGGAFGHVDGIEALSHGTQLFAPDHPNHAPFIPQPEHACAACAVANAPAPEPAGVFFAPPASRPSPEALAERAASAPVLPGYSGRSPPSAA